MAMISCPRCGHPLSDTAPACPRCGCVMTTSELNIPREAGLEQAPAPGQPPTVTTYLTPQHKSPWFVVFGLALAVLMILFAVGVSCSTLDGSSTDWNMYAYAFAKVYIKENYAAKANFNRASTTISSSGSDYTVSGEYTYQGQVNTYTIQMTIYSKSSADIYAVTLNDVPVV